MAAIKIVYIGGGATRGPGTIASFVKQWQNFAGSEIVLVDIDEQGLDLAYRVGQRFIEAEGADLTLRATTERRAALEGADVVLTSFRPGGFAARRLDERIPLRYDVIGQETQGPGGFFMALRTLNVFKGIVQDIEEICPDALIVNYTNPINIVSEAITRFTKRPIISLCEGPITFPRDVAVACGLDPAKLDVLMIGVNHACWSVRHLYDGQDFVAIVRDAYDRVMADSNIGPVSKRRVEMTALLGHVPAHYFQYYYYRDEVLEQYKNAARTRSEVIMDEIPSYLDHYREQAQAEHPYLDPARSRGGIMELELAVDVIEAIFNDRNTVFPCNVPNRGAIANFPDERVVEVSCVVNRHGATPIVSGALPPHLAGLVESLATYQARTAEAAWYGTRLDGIHALASHPLVLDLRKATAIYDEMAEAHRAYLPERLLP